MCDYHKEYLDIMMQTLQPIKIFSSYTLFILGFLSIFF